MLIKSLLVEHQVLALSGYLLIEVQTLLLEFSRLREASELYQLVMKVAAMDAR